MGPNDALAPFVDAVAEAVAAKLRPQLERPTTAPAELTWRERLWLCPAQTRLGVREAAEALGRPVSWIYRRTAPGSDKAPLPHRKLDDGLVFLAGELRDWITGHEAVVCPAPPNGSAA